MGRTRERERDLVIKPTNLGKKASALINLYAFICFKILDL